VSGRVGVDPVGFVLEHDTFPERDRAQGAHPLTGDLEVVDPHIQVKLLRWPLVRPAGRAVIGDLLEHQASPAVGASAMSTEPAFSCTRSQPRTAAQNRAEMSASGQSTTMFISWPTGVSTPGNVAGLGFRNLTNYIARSLLESGGFRPRLHPRM
jgi:hypothetical protein